MKASHFCGRGARILTSVIFSSVLLASAALAGRRLTPRTTRWPERPGVAAGDFTQTDGSLAWRATTGRSPSVAPRGDGKGGLPRRFHASGGCRSTWPGDFDEDGKLDLAISSDTPRRRRNHPRAVRIFFGDGKGNFPRFTEPFDLSGANDPTKYSHYPYLVAADVLVDGQP